MKWYEKIAYIKMFVATAILFAILTLLFISTYMSMYYPQTYIPLEDMVCCPDCDLKYVNTEAFVAWIFNIYATAIILAIMWGIIFTKFVLNKNKEYRDAQIQQKNTGD